MTSYITPVVGLTPRFPVFWNALFTPSVMQYSGRTVSNNKMCLKNRWHKSECWHDGVCWMLWNIRDLICVSAATLGGSGFGGLEVDGFKPGRSRRIFQGDKILSTPSFGREVKPFVPCRRFTACKRSLNVTWKSGIFKQNSSAISRPNSSSFHC